MDFEELKIDRVKLKTEITQLLDAFASKYTGVTVNVNANAVPKLFTFAGGKEVVVNTDIDCTVSLTLDNI